MDRIVAATSGSMFLTLHSASATPDSVTVTGTSRRTGATVLDGVTAVAHAGPGQTWKVALDGTEVTDPDVVDTVWTATIGAGTVDFAAPFEFTGAAYAAREQVADRAGSSTVRQQLDALVAVAERIETYTGWTWVPRWHSRTVMSDRHGTVRLPRPDVPLRQLLKVIDTDGNNIDVTNMPWTPQGIVHTGRCGQRLTVTWEAGEDQPPGDLAAAALDAAEDGARALAIRDRRKKADFGDAQFPFQHADLSRRRPFGIDGVDAIVNGKVSGVAA